MKNKLYDHEKIGDRRASRPPLPADSKYREQQKRGEIFEDLVDDDEDAYHPITPQKSPS